MQLLKYSPEVKLLLLRYSEEKEELLYNSNPFAWPMPKVGPRPPYYVNPRYVKNYPII
ncbi:MULTISPECIES: hypothetical protein [Bacillus]|uniref:Uncharacterized protein n=1 Tax=Bacillus capparidis TaxID=1840411 RepID=A0ABS4CT98_9BACI|nr:MULTISPECIES: hypothetical protein [Bacillus]MBP1080245.1 hypothetical protein [Bacillus capparidis]MED1094112.1 hypothetical protein [Bacillus capparidis]